MDESLKRAEACLCCEKMVRLAMECVELDDEAGLVSSSAALTEANNGFGDSSGADSVAEQDR